MRLNSADEIGTLPQTPVWGEQFNGQPLWAWPNFAGGREPTKTKRFLDLELPFDFGAAHARAHSWGD